MIISGWPQALTEAVRRHMALAVEMGHGEVDMGATYYAHSMHEKG